MVPINTEPGQEAHETVKLTIEDPDLAVVRRFPGGQPDHRR